MMINSYIYKFILLDLLFQSTLNPVHHRILQRFLHVNFYIHFLSSDESLRSHYAQLLIMFELREQFLECNSRTCADGTLFQSSLDSAVCYFLQSM